MNENTKKELILQALENSEYDLFSNITVKEVAKDLKMGENLANEVFKREDFPSVNIGKNKNCYTFSLYILENGKKELKLRYINILKFYERSF